MILPILTGAGALVVAGYNTMSPTSQLYGQTFIGEERGAKRLALTFDDGPNDPHTLHLLEVLAKHNVKATFFVIGKFARERPDILRMVADAGHAVGNHTFSHPNLIFCSAAATRRQLADCQSAIQDAIGTQPALFRPPFGGRRPSSLRAVRAEGYEPVMWSVTAHDWNARSAQQIVRTVTRQVRGGDVILLHDGSHVHMGGDRSYTVQATDELIRRYLGEGFSFVTIPEMMNTGTQ